MIRLLLQVLVLILAALVMWWMGHANLHLHNFPLFLAALTTLCAVVVILIVAVERGRARNE